MRDLQKNVNIRKNNTDLHITADLDGLSAIAKACGLSLEQFVMVVMKTTIKKKETEDDSCTL